MSYALRTAIEARDLEAIATTLADDVVFTSPVAFKPYPGKAITVSILEAVLEVFEDFHYVREFGDDTDHALIFEATVDGKAIMGCDFLHHDADGLIDEFMVMVRPLSEATALAEQMGARFATIAERAELRTAGSL